MDIWSLGHVTDTSDMGHWTSNIGHPVSGRSDRRYSYNSLMRFGISTQIQRGSTVTLDLLESIRKAGYERFELFCNRPHLDFHSRSLMRSIGRWFRENALPAPSIHLPFIEGGGREEKMWVSALSSDRKERAYAIDAVSYTHLRAHETPEHL